MKFHCALVGILIALYFKNLSMLYKGGVSQNLIYGIAGLSYSLRLILVSDYQIGKENWIRLAVVLSVCWATILMEWWILKTEPVDNYTVIKYGVMMAVLGLYDLTVKKSIGILIVILGMCLL